MVTINTLLLKNNEITPYYQPKININNKNSKNKNYIRTYYEDMLRYLKLKLLVENKGLRMGGYDGGYKGIATNYNGDEERPIYSFCIDNINRQHPIFDVENLKPIIKLPSEILSFSSLQVLCLQNIQGLDTKNMPVLTDIPTYETFENMMYRPEFNLDINGLPNIEVIDISYNPFLVDLAYIERCPKLRFIISLF